LSWGGASEKLNQFLNLSSFAEQMLVHENANRPKIRKDMPLELAAVDRLAAVIHRPTGAVVNTAESGARREPWW